MTMLPLGAQSGLRRPGWRTAVFKQPSLCFSYARSSSHAAASARCRVSTSSVDAALREGTNVEDASSSSPSASANTVRGKRKKFVDEGEVLKSSWSDRAWTAWGFALVFQLGYQGASSLNWSSGLDVFGVVLTLASAYIFADFGTGVFHWAVDNYGNAETPVFGRQIAAFQGHHQRPWTITQREFCNNVHQVFKPASYILLLLLAASPWTPGLWDLWAASVTFLACMSQQFHAWSHMGPSDLPDAIVAMQNAGLLVSRKEHGVHHRAPYDCKYCIVSGVCNAPMDASGVFPAAERLIYSITGVEPRSWADPKDNQDWQEVART